MHRKSTARRRRRPALCALCARPLDWPSGFVFVVEPGNAVHPDCFSWHLAGNPIAFGTVLHHTCGDANCVNPDHLEVR
jgi:hypothetical protein